MKAFLLWLVAEELVEVGTLVAERILGRNEQIVDEYVGQPVRTNEIFGISVEPGLVSEEIIADDDSVALYGGLDNEQVIIAAVGRLDECIVLCQVIDDRGLRQLASVAGNKNLDSVASGQKPVDANLDPWPRERRILSMRSGHVRPIDEHLLQVFRLADCIEGSI